MMAVEDGTPVQDTSRQETSSEMDSGYFTETPLSIEETTWENNPINQTKKTNLDIVGDNHATEEYGPDYKPSPGKGPDNMDFLCMSLNSNDSEEYEAKSKTSDGISNKDNAPTDLQQDINVQEITRKDYHTTMPCAFENDVFAAIVSEHSTINIFQENFAPEKHKSDISATEVPESGHNGDCKPSDQLLAHHEDSNIFSGTDGDASDFRSDSSSSIDAYTTTTCCKLKGGANMDKNNTEEKEVQDGANMDKNREEKDIRTSTDHEGDNNDNSCHGPNINEAHNKEGKSKAFDWTSHNENSSTGLLVTEVTRPNDHTTFILRSEDSVIAGPEENNPTLEEQSLNSSTTEVSESGHDCNVGYKPNAYTTATCCKIQDGANMDKNNARNSKIKTFTDHGGDNNDCYGDNNDCNGATEVSESGHDCNVGYRPNGHAYTTATCCKMQDGANKDKTNAKDSEIITSTGHGEDNNDCYGDNNGCNGATEVSESDHNGSMDCKLNGEILAHYEVNSSFSPASQTGGNGSNFRNAESGYIDDCATNKHSELPTGCGDDEDFTPSTSTKMCSDKTVSTSPENETSTDNNDFRHRRPNINKTGAKEKKSKTFNSTSVKGNKRETDEKNHSGGTSRLSNGGAGLWEVLCFTICMMVLVAVTVAQGFPAQPQWQQVEFCTLDGSLLNQPLSFVNLATRVPFCEANLTKVPSYHNCSESQSLLFADNDTCIVMVTKVYSEHGFNLECGRTRNADDVHITPLGRLNDTEVMEKIAKYNEPPNSTISPQHDGEGSYTMWIICGVVGAVLVLAVAFALLYFKSKRNTIVSYCRRRRTNQTPKADVEQPLKEVTNGHVANGESHQK